MEILQECVTLFGNIKVQNLDLAMEIIKIFNVNPRNSTSFLKKP